MSLRIQSNLATSAQIQRADGAPAPLPASAEGDSWLTRLVKMIPAEAIGLYSTALPFVQDGKYGRQIAAVIALVVALVIRYVCGHE